MLIALRQLYLDISPARPLGELQRVDRNALRGSNATGSTPTLRRVF
jgi:hypothetical protein